MGKCGCTDFNPEFKFKAPGNGWYVLQRYPGCEDCETPAGVIMFRLDMNESNQWDLKDIAEKPLTGGRYLIPVIHSDHLKKYYARYLQVNAEEIADDVIDASFGEAVIDSLTWGDIL